MPKKEQITLEKLYKEFASFRRENARAHNKIDKKQNKLFDFLDKEVLENKAKIKVIENHILKVN